MSAACFVVQSCLTDADFVVFSNYCLIGICRTGRPFFSRDLDMDIPRRGLNVAGSAGGGGGEGDVAGAASGGELFPEQSVPLMSPVVAAMASEAASQRSRRMSPVVVCALSSPSATTSRRFRSPVVAPARRLRQRTPESVLSPVPTLTVSAPALRLLSRMLPVAVRTRMVPSAEAAQRTGHALQQLRARLRPLRGAGAPAFPLAISGGRAGRSARGRRSAAGDPYGHHGGIRLRCGDRAGAPPGHDILLLRARDPCKYRESRSGRRRAARGVPP